MDTSCLQSFLTAFLTRWSLIFCGNKGLLEFSGMKALLVFFSILIVVFSGARAQTSLHISGKLVDSVTGSAADYITVYLINNRDSLTATSLSDQAGMIHFFNLSPGAYRLHIHGLGYRDTVLSLGNLITNRDSLVIRLNPSSKNLEEIRVIASKPVIRQQADRIAYDLDADAESKSLN